MKSRHPCTYIFIKVQNTLVSIISQMSVYPHSGQLLVFILNKHGRVC